MSGYSNYSMSNNALLAYECGLCPASKIKGVPASLVSIWCPSDEWHHSSKNFNKVDFYNPVKVRAIFGLEESDDYPADAGAMQALAAHKLSKKDTGVAYKNCKVDWIEWTGTMKHPKAADRSASGCKVIVKGQTATVTLPDGTALVKRLNTRGFYFNTSTAK